MGSVADVEAMTVLSRTVRRQRLFLISAVVAALAASGGLVASTLVKSPAQQAAEARPPAASVLTAPVVRKVLGNTVVVRGTVTAGGNITVTPQPAAGGGSGTGGGPLLLSKITAKPGAEITAGQVLAEVSGRPIIALPGLVPAYRDLKPNTDGDDVTQLQAALAGLGYSCDPDTKGHFGAGTKAALTAFYAHIGYSPATTGGARDAGDKAALQAASDAVVQARRTVAADKLALDKANKALADAVKAATSSTTSPTTAYTGNSVPSHGGAAGSQGSGPTVSGPTSAPAGGGPQSALAAAKDTVQQAQTTYGYALQDLAKAQQAQSDLQAATGVEMPAAEVVYVPSFPVRLSKLNAVLGQAVSGPLLTLSSGQLIISSVLQPGQNELVKPGMKAQLDAEALGNQQAAATVSAVGPLNTGQTNNANTGGQANGGQTGSAAGSGPGTSAGSSGGPGQQQSSDQPQQSASGYPMTVTPVMPLPASWVGQDIRVTVSNAATSGPVLSVPLSAVSTGADGQTSVTVVGVDGSQHRVTVAAGASTDGDVQVAPIAPDTLQEGDNVIIGQAQQ